MARIGGVLLGAVDIGSAHIGGTKGPEMALMAFSEWGRHGDGELSFAIQSLTLPEARQGFC